MAKKILIIGGPRCGKTTYARKLSKSEGLPIVSFDDFMRDHDWSELSDRIADWLSEPGPWIKEGVQGVRGLRKWLRANPHPPDFEVHVLNDPKIPLSKGQATMHKAHATILKDVERQLKLRKYDVKYIKTEEMPA